MLIPHFFDPDEIPPMTEADIDHLRLSPQEYADLVNNHFVEPTHTDNAPAMPPWWHVSGNISPADSGVILDGTRKVSGATPTEAASKILEAAKAARGGEWHWITAPQIERHFAWDDPSCAICKRLATRRAAEE